MKHCLNPKGDTLLRLFRKNSTRFQYAAHPEQIVDSSIGTLSKYLLHYPFKNLSSLLNKVNYYSSLSVEKLESRQVRPCFLKALGHASCMFIKIYFLKLGFLDG